MHTDVTAVLPTLCDEDRRIADLHAELHATRIAIMRSLLLSPDALDDREPLWVRFFELRRDVANTIDRIADAVASLNAPVQPRERAGCCVPVARADGTTDWVPSARAFPYLGEVPAGWMPGAADAVVMPACDRRLALLAS